MGVVYTGRYKHISGIKNFAEIPVTVPPVQANETTWLDYPLANDSSSTGAAIANNRMAVATSNGSTGSGRGVKTFVYGIDNQSLPNVLIAEIPAKQAVVRVNVSFSPNGRYLMIRSQYLRSDLDPDQLEIYEVFEDRVEFKRSISNLSVVGGFYWFGDSDHFLYKSSDASQINMVGDRNRLYVGCMSKPLLKTQVGSNEAYRFLCQIAGTNDFVYEDFIIDPGNESFRRVVGRLDPATGVVTTVTAKVTGDIDTSANLQLREFISIGEGYIVKRFQKPDGSLGRDLFAYVGGTFIRLGEYPANMAETAQIAATGNIIATSFHGFSKLGFIQVGAIGASVEMISNVSHEGSSPGTVKAVLYNVLSNRIVVVEDSGVRSYALASNGFKLPKAPEEPRFFFDLTSSTAPTKSLYTLPQQVKTGNPAVKVIDGVSCVEFSNGASMAQPMLNLMDFAAERGYMHFWVRWENLAASQSIFSFANFIIRPQNDYHTPQSNPNAAIQFFNNNGGSFQTGIGVIQRYKWNHILIAWDRGNVGWYVNGQREFYTSNNLKRPVRDFNNKQISLSNPSSSSTVQFRDLAIHSGDTMGLMQNIEPAFIPPNWSQYRNNAAWPSIADGALPIGQTPIITPKFS